MINDGLCGLRIRITFMLIRIQFHTLMRIWGRIQLSTFMRIRIQVQLPTSIWIWSWIQLSTLKRIRILLPIKAMQI
jgi:hypothetical protein